MAGAQKMFLDCRKSSPLNIWRCYQVSPSLLRIKILGSPNCFMYRNTLLWTPSRWRRVCSELCPPWHLGPSYRTWGRGRLICTDRDCFSSQLFHLLGTRVSWWIPQTSMFSQELWVRALSSFTCINWVFEMKARVSHLFLLKFTLL